MNVPASPRRRKVRLIREEPAPDDALVVLRAAAPDRPRTLRNAVLDATESGATYVVDRGGGRREVLYGISVFACRAGREPEEILSAFPLSPLHLELSVGQIREAGFDVIATGTNPDHYDVQLVPGRFEGDHPEATAEELRGAVARLLWAAGDLKANPAYAGGDPGPEDEG